MPKRYPAQTTTIAGELYFSGLDVAEITRRLNTGEAGLPHPIEISGRSVREKVRRYETEHGPRPDLIDQDQTHDSFMRRSRQAEAVFARVIAYYDRRSPGKLSAADMQRLQRAHAYLAVVMRDTEKTAKVLKRKRPRSKAQSEKAEPESAIDLLARKQREASTAGPSTPEPRPTQTNTDERSASAPVPEQRTGNGNGAGIGG